MNYTTDCKSLRGQVSAEEWRTRVDLAACYRLVDIYGMTDLLPRIGSRSIRATRATGQEVRDRGLCSQALISIPPYHQTAA
jgi:hypothetical protein